MFTKQHKEGLQKIVLLYTNMEYAKITSYQIENQSLITNDLNPIILNCSLRTGR